MLGLQDTVDKLERANGLHWYKHVLRKNADGVLRRALDFKVNRRRGVGRPRKLWRRLVEEEIRKIGLSQEDVLNRLKWKGVK